MRICKNKEYALFAKLFTTMLILVSWKNCQEKKAVVYYEWALVGKCQVPIVFYLIYLCTHVRICMYTVNLPILSEKFIQNQLQAVLYDR